MKVHNLQRLLWAIGGFDSVTLSREQCRAVRPKYSSMGLLVLMTAMLAACSGGYALWSVFGDLRVAVSVSVMWGGLILSLDRLLVSSTRKTATLKEYYTGLHTVPPYKSLSPVAPIVIRVLLAGAIGFVVAKPIEARLMRPWVIRHDIEVGNTQIRKAEESPALTTLRAEITQLNERLEAKDRDVAKASAAVSEEVDGTGGTEKRGVGPIAERKQELYEQSLREAKQLRVDLQARQQEYTTEHTRILSRIDTQNDGRERDESIIKALLSIHELSNADNGNSGFISMVSLALTILFVLIESIPVVAKALSSFDAYDAALQDLEHAAILDSLSGTRDKHEQVMGGSQKLQAAESGGD